MPVEQRTVSRAVVGPQANDAATGRRADGRGVRPSPVASAVPSQTLGEDQATVTVTRHRRTRKEAQKELQLALVVQRERGVRLACCGASQDLWFATARADRRKAQRRCAGCPVTVECRHMAQAHHEEWGVWGGQDFTRTSTRAGR